MMMMTMTIMTFVPLSLQETKKAMALFYHLWWVALNLFVSAAVKGHFYYLIQIKRRKNKTPCRLKTNNNLDVLYGAEWSKELPESAFLSFWSQVVDEQAPTRTTQSVARYHTVRQCNGTVHRWITTVTKTHDFLYQNVTPSFSLVQWNSFLERRTSEKETFKKTLIVNIKQRRLRGSTDCKQFSWWDA